MVIRYHNPYHLLSLPFLPLSSPRKNEAICLA
jgi:hypothetical protein